MRGTPITYLHLDEAFVDFALNVCEAATADLVIEDLEDTIRLRHGEAQPIHLPEHPRPLWELKTYFLRFRYQVLSDKVEVGGIWSVATGQVYEPKHDLFAEFTK